MALANERPRVAASLIERQTARVDRLRAKLARKGAIAHRVFVRLYRYAGGERFHGRREMVEELELTPPPEVQGVGGQRYSVTTGGSKADGTIRMVGISPRYTEADLDLLVAERADDEEVEIHLVPDGREGSDPMVKRYRPANKPERGTLTFEWRISLELLDEKRKSALENGAR